MKNNIYTTTIAKVTKLILYTKTRKRENKTATKEKKGQARKQKQKRANIVEKGASTSERPVAEASV